MVHSSLKQQRPLTSPQWGEMFIDQIALFDDKRSVRSVMWFLHRLASRYISLLRSEIHAPNERIRLRGSDIFVSIRRKLALRRSEMFVVYQ